MGTFRFADYIGGVGEAAGYGAYFVSANIWGGIRSGVEDAADGFELS